MTSRASQRACSPSAARRAFRPTYSKPRCARKAATRLAPCISLDRQSSVRRKAAPRSPCSIRRRCRSRGSREWSARKSCCNRARGDRKSTRLNSSHSSISYAVFCLKKKKKKKKNKKKKKKKKKTKKKKKKKKKK